MKNLIILMSLLLFVSNAYALDDATIKKEICKGSWELKYKNSKGVDVFSEETYFRNGRMVNVVHLTNTNGNNKLNWFVGDWKVEDGILKKIVSVSDSLPKGKTTEMKVLMIDSRTKKLFFESVKTGKKYIVSRVNRYASQGLKATKK